MTLSGTEPDESPAPDLSRATRAAQRLSVAYQELRAVVDQASMATRKLNQIWAEQEARNKHRKA